MRKGSILAILLSGLACFGICPNLVGAVSPVGLMISEVQISGQSAQDEFVEIYNNSELDFDLSVCRLVKYSAGGTTYILHRFGEGAQIAPRATFVVAGMDFSTTHDAVYSTSQSLAINNSVALICNEETQDLVAWGTATIKENNVIVSTTDLSLWSYQRIKNLDSDDNALDFTVDVPTPGVFMFDKDETVESELGIFETEIVENQELVQEEEVVMVPSELAVAIEGEMAETETEIVTAVEITEPTTVSVNQDESIVDSMLPEISETSMVDSSVVSIESDVLSDTNDVISTSSVPAVRQLAIDSLKVFLNELYPAPDIGEFEYLELYNADSISVDLNDWYVTDLSAKKFILKNIVLLPGEYLLLPYSMTKISQNNDEDQINLYNSLGQWRHGVRYAKAQKGKALLLTEDLQWKWGSPSPGTVNVFVKPNVAEELSTGLPTTTSGESKTSNQLVGNEGKKLSSEGAENLILEEVPPELVSVSGVNDDAEREQTSSNVKSKSVRGDKTKVYVLSALSEWRTWEANDLLILHGRVVLDSNWGITNRCFIAEGNYALPVLCTTLKDKFVLGETIELKAKVYFKNNQFEYLKPVEVDFYDQEVVVTFSDDGQNLSEYQLWQSQGIVDIINKSGRIGQLANDEWVWDFRFSKNSKFKIGDTVAWQAVYYKGENYFLGKAFFEKTKIDIKNIVKKMKAAIFSGSNLVDGKFTGKFYLDRGRKAAIVHCLKSL